MKATVGNIPQKQKIVSIPIFVLFFVENDIEV